MWFRLNTVFTESLGKLDELTNSWSIIRDLRNFSTNSNVTSVTKDGSYSAVFTLNSDCTYTSHSVTMGGEAVSASQAVWDASTGKLTVNIAKVTADVSIKAYASKNSTGGGGGGGDASTSVFVSETGATLLENTAMSTTSSTPTTNNTYYTYQFIPVVGGTTYRMQYARRVWELDSNKAELKTFAAHNDCENYTFTVGDTTAYISVTVKTAEIAATKLTLETIG